MAILVTGGAGYIGSHTVVELLSQTQQEEVVIVDNFSNSKPAVLERIEQITGKRPVFYELDILDREALLEVFKQHAIDTVIHFAGFKAVGESVAKPLEYYHNNIGGAVALLQVMAQVGVKRIIFSSSATVYGETNPVPFKEDMPTGGTSNPYGYSKLVIEEMLKDLVHSDPSWSVAILRYFNPIGAHESGLIGEDPQGIPNNLMPYVTQVAVGKMKELRVFGDDYPTPDGTGVRDYIHVVDLAQGHVQAVDYARQHEGLSIFNLGTGVGYSVFDIVKAFEQATGVEIPYQIVDRRPGDIAQAYADVNHVGQVLGWRAKKDLESMCRDAWNWQSKNPQGYSEI